jgi:large subunit ribosomal protein L29
VKAEELAVLDQHELTDRLKASRRELYELRFQLAVGQLENNREVRKVKKDIARILTVIRSRELFAVPAKAVEAASQPPPASPEAGEEAAPQPTPSSPEAGEETAPTATASASGEEIEEEEAEE